MNFKYAKFNLLRFISLKASMNKIKQVSKYDKNSCFIFGSDEIWNLDRSEMSSFPVLWGMGIEAAKKISYAPSVNGCKLETLEASSFAANIGNFHALSVRDDYSKCVIQKLTGRDDVKKVLDPTMLISQEEYLAKSNYKHYSDYIAIYIFNPSEEMKNILLSISKHLNKKLISLGRWYSWCDACVVSENPFEYYADADYVITNTFHGTAFAINFHKKFIAFAKSSKVKELLIDFDLEKRNAINMSENEIEALLQTEIDYDEVDSILKQKRIQSLNYLYGSIENDC